MTNVTEDPGGFPDDAGKPSLLGRVKALTKGKTAKRAFWVWIGYQSVKGMITLCLIWIPLLYWWLNNRAGP
ncbi:MAG: hypothetical protein AAGC56_08975 [Pseudomonadota bacterium]